VPPANRTEIYKKFIFINDHWIAFAHIESLHYDEGRKFIEIKTCSGNFFRMNVTGSDPRENAAYAKDWMAMVMMAVKSDTDRYDDPPPSSFPPLESTF